MSTSTSCRPTTARVPALLPVVGAGTQVPLATGGRLPYANLDLAASAPALQQVKDRVDEALPLYSSVHRGAGWTSQISTRAYEASRRRIGRFVGAREDDVVVLTRNTTDALNLLASSVPADAGEVLVLDIEHHANLLPWLRGRHRVLPAAGTLTRTLTVVEEALAVGDVALLAVTGASNVTGEELPVAHLAELAHTYGARIVVDAAQLAPHRRISLQDSGVDYLALSGHKLYAPFGAGVLVGRRDWLDAADPYLAGGGAVREVGLAEVQWAPAPARHEAGTPNVLGAVALAAACEALAALPDGALEVHEEILRARLVDGLREIDGVRVQRIWHDSPSSIGVVTFTVDGLDAGLVAAVLSAEHGVGVRDGKFCAHPLLARLGLDHGAVRASIGVGTSSDDVDRLVAAVTSLVAEGPVAGLRAGRGSLGAGGRQPPAAGVARRRRRHRRLVAVPGGLRAGRRGPAGRPAVAPQAGAVARVAVMTRVSASRRSSSSPSSIPRRSSTAPGILSARARSRLPLGVSETASARSSRGSRPRVTRPDASSRLSRGLRVAGSRLSRSARSATLSGASSHRASITRYCGWVRPIGSSSGR